MLNVTTNTNFNRIFNRTYLSKIEDLTIIVDNKVLDCEVISVTPKYIYFKIRNLILQKGRFEYSILADEVVIDSGILNLK